MEFKSKLIVNHHNENRNPVSSLLSLCTEYVAYNLPSYIQQDLKSLVYIPNYIKNKILRKITQISISTRINFDKVLPILLQSTTKYINLTSVVVDDDIIKSLEVCSDLRELLIICRKSGTDNITSNALLNLFKQIHELRFLQLSDCDAFNDDVLECLTSNSPNIVGIHAKGCKNITDKGLKSLNKLNNLTLLMLANTNVIHKYQISDEGISDVVKGGNGKSIKELRIDNCVNITDDGLAAIAKHCPNIEILTYFNCSTSINTFEVLQNISNVKSLKQLTWTVTW